jgi:hypothetical protein
MLELIIVVLVVLWLLGYFGRVSYPYLTGNFLHLLLFIALIVLIIRLI